jgi:hypothetical protein
MRVVGQSKSRAEDLMEAWIRFMWVMGQKLQVTFGSWKRQETDCPIGLLQGTQSF